MGMPSVAQIFKVHSEAFFRDNEVAIAEFICYLLNTLECTSCLSASGAFEY